MLLDCAFLPSLQTTILALVLLILIYHWFNRPTNFPPGPRGVPFAGVLPFLGKYPERVIKEWSEKYGDIMSIRMGPKDMVILNSYESIQQVGIGMLFFICMCGLCNHYPFHSWIVDRL